MGTNQTKRRHDLTPGDEEFVRRYVRTSVEAEQLAAFRECRCAGSERPDGPALGAMRRFLKRSDVSILVNTEAHRYRIMLLKAHREADGVLADGIMSDAEGRQAVKDALLLAITEEAERLRQNDERSMSSMAKAAEVYGKLTAQDGGGEKELTEEEAKAAIEALRGGSPEQDAGPKEEPARHGGQTVVPMQVGGEA